MLHQHHVLPRDLGEKEPIAALGVGADRPAKTGAERGRADLCVGDGASGNIRNASRDDVRAVIRLCSECCRKQAERQQR